jgi:acyl-CoA thioesterase FadM
MLHFAGILLNENNELAAIFETVLGHINLNERKMVPFSDDRLKNILEYKERTKLDQDLPFELKLKIRDL